MSDKLLTTEGTVVTPDPATLPVKKQRKQRADKGTKRGPRKPKTAVAAQAN